MVPRRPIGEISGFALLAGSALLVLLSVGGFYLGNYLDYRFGTTPTLGIIGLILGAVIGFWELYRIAFVIFRSQPVPPPADEHAWDEDETDDASRED